MKRRQFLRESANLAIQATALSALLGPAFLKLAHADPVPLDGLRASIGADDGLVLAPADTQFASYHVAFNKRTLVTPTVIVACKSASAAIAAIQWARANQVPIATRCGGHSYEGFSQTSGLVIDVRQINDVQVDETAQTASIGSGAALGQVYSALYAHKLTIPAGSCPTVGISGHTLGGGFGLLGRKFGLACDSLQSVQLVDASGNLLTADDTQNTDLLWACRGGGGGSFGVVTRLGFGLHPIDQVAVFGLGWSATAAQALKLIQAYQGWAPLAPDELTALLTLTKSGPGAFSIRCSGQFVGSETDLRTLLQPMIAAVAPATQNVSTMPFIQAVSHFSGGSSYPSVFMKGKSDYVTSPLSVQAINTILNQLAALPPGGVGLICDSYGGAVNRVAADATAFAHRDGTLFSIQYFSQWYDPSVTQTRLGWIRGLYSAMRPYVSGGAYVNYCDLDLPDWQHAYWGANFDRLTRIKAAYDPENFFNHAQSIPPAAS